MVPRQIERGAITALVPAWSRVKTEVWTGTMLVTDRPRRLLS
jgi:hypothetical protein